MSTAYQTEAAVSCKPRLCGTLQRPDKIETAVHTMGARRPTQQLTTVTRHTGARVCIPQFNDCGLCRCLPTPHRTYERVEFTHIACLPHRVPFLLSNLFNLHLSPESLSCCPTCLTYTCLRSPFPVVQLV